ncbi:hypothetical protein Gpo141_00007617 [Globisporangium polare]
MNFDGVIPANMPPEQIAAILQAIADYVENKIKGLSIVLLVTYSVLCVLCITLVVYLRLNRNGALRGDLSAARKTLLPAFEPLFWILGFTTGVYCIYFIAAFSVAFYPTELPSVHTECFYAGRQFVLLLVIIFMLQKSVTIPALTRAVGITLALSTYTLPIVWYIQNHSNTSNTNRNFWIQTIAHGLVLPLYMYVMVRPPSRSSTKALRRYCAFALSQHALDIAYSTAFNDLKVDLGFGLAYAELAVGSLCPLFVWHVLKDDTEHWRGLGQRACALQALFRQKSNVHEHLSSEGLHVLIEMHRKYIIDFAYLELRQRIGIGSSAVVYNGILNSKTPVAVKVYTPTTVTEDTVAEFSHEAALCGALNHPNIVRFYGMCVSPPTICLVSELCQGSLDEVTWAIAQRALVQGRQPNEPRRRQQFLINLGYMIDAARAVAYIHSFSPAFVHRDIKPANFLVDTQGTVKLTDFGESRFLPKMSPSNGTNGSSATAAVASTAAASDTFNNDSDFEAESTTGSSGSSRKQHHHSAPTPKSPAYVDYEAAKRDEAKTLAMVSGMYGGQLSQTARSTLQMTVKGTVDYMAPEMINGKGGLANYGEAADVYSLAITMWDVLNPEKEKYPSSNNNHLRIFESVIAGSRPELDPMLHPMLRDLLTSSWHQDHWRRPSAAAIVQVLERVQEEVASMLAAELQDELEAHAGGVLFKVGDSTVVSVSGDALTEKLRGMHSVSTASEGLRLGNMLMDAGFLHHVKHARCFECSDAMYFFDDDHIRFCQPFAMLEGGNEQSPPLRRSHQHQHQPQQRPSLTDAPGHNGAPGSPTSWLGRPLFPPPNKRGRNDSSAAAADFSDTTSTTESTAGLLGKDGFATGESSSANGTTSQGTCPCRRLGQRLQQQKSVKRLFRSRKHAPIPEDNVLTANLLAQESHGTGGPHNNNRSLDGFDETPMSYIV